MRSLRLFFACVLSFRSLGIGPSLQAGSQLRNLRLAGFAAAELCAVPLNLEKDNMVKNSISSFPSTPHFLRSSERLSCKYFHDN